MPRSRSVPRPSRSANGIQVRLRWRKELVCRGQLHAPKRGALLLISHSRISCNNARCNSYAIRITHTRLSTIILHRNAGIGVLVLRADTWDVRNIGKYNCRLRLFARYTFGRMNRAKRTFERIVARQIYIARYIYYKYIYINRYIINRYIVINIIINARLIRIEFCLRESWRRSFRSRSVPSVRAIPHPFWKWIGESSASFSTQSASRITGDGIFSFDPQSSVIVPRVVSSLSFKTSLSKLPPWPSLFRALGNNRFCLFHLAGLLLRVFLLQMLERSVVNSRRF